MARKQPPSDPDRVPHDDESTTWSDTEDPIRLSLAEETLDAHVVVREQGKVRIHKRVETEPVTARVELHHDDYVVDEIELNEEATERREPWHEGETLMVPVYEEVLVSHTQLMLRKVIRLHNRGSKEEVNLKGTVRREVVDIEDVDASG